MSLMAARHPSTRSNASTANFFFIYSLVDAVECAIILFFIFFKWFQWLLVQYGNVASRNVPK